MHLAYPFVELFDSQVLQRFIGYKSIGGTLTSAGSTSGTTMMNLWGSNKSYHFKCQNSLCMVKTYFGTPAVKRILITKLQETLLTLWHNLYLISILGCQNHKNEFQKLIWSLNIVVLFNFEWYFSLDFSNIWKSFFVVCLFSFKNASKITSILYFYWQRIWLKKILFNFLTLVLTNFL